MAASPQCCRLMSRRRSTQDSVSSVPIDSARVREVDFTGRHVSDRRYYLLRSEVKCANHS